MRGWAGEYRDRPSGAAAAGALLALVIHPRQRAALADPDDGTRLRTLSMLAGFDRAEHSDLQFPPP